MGFASSVFFVVLINLINVKSIDGTKDQQVERCKSSGTNRCRDDGPEIRFPFWLEGRQQDHDCKYPAGFQLSCSNQKQTMLQLPNSSNGNFLVKRIDYVNQVLSVTDPGGCIFARLLHLNLSSSPFIRYEDDASSSPGEALNYTLFNCSSTDRNSLDYRNIRPISCLSVRKTYDVYAMPNTAYLTYMPLMSCTIGKTIRRPELGFLARQLDFDDKNDLVLRWFSPNCARCEAIGQGCRSRGNSSAGPQIECFHLPRRHHATKTAIMLVAAAGLVVAFLLLIAMIIVRRRYRAFWFDKLERANQDKIEKFLEDYKSLKPTRYSYADIKRITNHFQKKLGEGGYGSVFKGIISNEIPVAVKILNNANDNGEEFINEVGTIGMIHHVNVVRLLGFCADGFRRALVYEFLPNESLEKFIFLRDSKTPFLGWTKLHDIAVGIAKGIEYLHQGCDQRILHFDIKPHNILLGYNFNPKISDFGLAKLCSKEKSVVSMSVARGTMGYIAPEVVSRNFGNVSYKSDVYSFGMMLLEMVGGRKNTDARAEKSSQVYFPEWIYNRINREEDLEIKVETEGDEKIARKLTIVGLWCIQWYPVDRPSMKTVVQMLEGETESLVTPPSPFASTATVKKNTGNINDKPAHQALSVISEQDELE